MSTITIQGRDAEGYLILRRTPIYVTEVAVSGGGGGGGNIISVNGKVGVVVLTTADIADTNNKRYLTEAERTKIANSITSAPVQSVNGETGVVVLDATDVGAYPSTNPSNFINASQAPVQSVNGEIGVVVIDKNDVGLGNVDNTSDLNKPVSSATQSALDLKVDKVTGKGLSDENYTLLEKQKLAGIEAGAEVNDVDSVNGQTGIVVLDADDVSDAATTNKYTTQSDKDRLANTSGTNTGDQVIPTSLPPDGNAGGDLTGTYPDPTIGNDKVTTAKILDSNVTLAKIENISTAKLLGRHSNGNGVVQQIGIDGGLEIQGANIRRAALTGIITAAAGSNTTAASTALQTAIDNANAALQPATADTGAVIDFVTSKVFNSPARPSTANITDDLTGAKIGTVQKIYHNHSVAPSVPAGWVLLGSGTYQTSELNIIYAEWVGSSRVEFWIIQEA
jgi:hypothetical protein